MTDLNITSTTVEKLADMTGMAIQEIYKVYAGAQAGLGLASALSTTIAILMGVLGLYLVIRAYRNDSKDKKKYDDGDDGFYVFMGILAVILVPIGVKILVSAIAMGLLHYMYPEYFAIQEMINTFSNLT